MTDFTSKNNVYYDMNVYNPTSVPIKAQIDNKMLFPLLNRADDYSVSLAKAKVPLDSIPLTRDNLPLKLYQLGLKIGTTEELAYVRQVNANQDNFVWNCPKGSTVITKYKYSSTGILTQESIQNLQLLVPYVYNFVVDNFQNLFVIGSLTSPQIINKLFIIDNNNILLQTLDFVHIKHIYIDRGQNLYVCDESETPTVYIYSMNNSSGNVNLTQKTTITTNFAGNQLTNLLFCVADGEMIIGYNTNTITLYNEQYEPQTDIQESAITQLQNIANIDSTSKTYIVSNQDELSDTLIGVKNEIPYYVSSNQQIANGNIKSPLALVQGAAFGIGDDNNTYFFAPYPPTSPPATWTQVNTAQPIKFGCLWSAQTRDLYGMSSTNEFYVWNYTYAPSNPTSAANIWTEAGVININYPTVSAISIDRQLNTRKLVAVGSDNNLYQTQDPVGIIEFFQSSGTNDPDYFYALGEATLTGAQENYLVRNMNNTFGNSLQLFKHGDNYVVPELDIDSGITTLVVYSVKDFSVVNTLNNFAQNGCNGMTPLPLSSKFIWADNAKIIYTNSLSDYSSSHTYTYFQDNSLPRPDYFYEINATHFVVVNKSQSIYIFQHSNNTPVGIFNIGVDSYVLDVCVSYQNTVNGANTIYVVTSPTSQVFTLGTKIKSITFTDNTYTAISSTATVYDVATDPSSSGKYITFIDYHQLQQSIIFIVANYITSPVITYTNKVLKTLFNTSNYELQYANTTDLLYQSVNAKYVPNKNSFYLQQTTSSTERWNQITTGTAVKAVNASRTSPNTLYCISNVDSKIYTGTLQGTTCTLSIIASYSATTYDYISSTENTSPSIESTLYLYGLQSQNLITSLVLNDECGEIARNEVANQYLISSKSAQQLRALDSSTLTQIFTVSLTGAYRLFSKNGSDIDAGKVDIYNISVLINSINNAFIEATTKINQALGSGTIATSPSISLDYQTGLCTLSYPSVFTQSANGILFNQPLLNMVYYESTLDQQSGLYQLVLNPQQETITQHFKTINKFNLLDKILFRSNSIYVVGAYFGLNDSNNIFFDIDVPTNDFIENLDQTLYFQPNFLRTYFLRSNLSLDDIQIQLYYEYKNGNAYELYINNGENVTVKLQFISKV